MKPGRFTARWRSGIALAAILAASPAHAQLAVSSTSPTMNAHNVARDSVVSVTFDRPVSTGTFTTANFKVFGKLTGPVAGTLSFANADHKVLFTPTRPLLAGELVLVIMSRNLRAADGTFLRSSGYTFMFNTATSPHAVHFRHHASISNRTGGSGGPQTRIYGGLACDLDRDGWSDLTTVNEVSADIRVFMNPANGSMDLPPMVTPHTPIPFEASPNEVGDWDNDGIVDIVVSSDGTDEVAICRGLGNGRFATPTLVTVGDNPRGFGILDADGDGDMDITVACANADRVVILLNNGNGTFAAPVNMTVTGGPYGMMAADMDNDGILDLAIGGRSDQTAKVLRGNGNGTFTQVSSRSMGGANWVVVVGDLNGDGSMDVSGANSFSANGSILLGNGDGTLQAVSTYPIGGHSVSSDLADLDGDGDLDWIVSSFGAGTWYCYLNNGSGGMTPLVDFEAPSNPSCAVPVDYDNDGDIDLLLTDEIADLVVVMENVCPGDYNGVGGVSVQDIFDFLAAYFAGDLDADFNRSGSVTVQDIFDFLSGYFGPC
ncbi:MAG: VCBS repeat-containing protein [Phycisphaerales bacterium]|nr:VCBS repeat-containing protein [Phycisphaerales bacterium]